MLLKCNYIEVNVSLKIKENLNKIKNPFMKFISEIYEANKNEIKKDKIKIKDYSIFRESFLEQKYLTKETFKIDDFLLYKDETINVINENNKYTIIIGDKILKLNEQEFSRIKDKIIVK